MPDFNFLMESRLPPPQSRVLNQLGRLAASQGLNLYLVGGAVRDLMLGLDRPRDLSFVVAGNVDKVVRPLSAHHAHRRAPARPPGAPPPGEPIDLELSEVKVDARLGAAQLVFADGIRAEIASARTDVFSAPGRPPETSPASIFDDLRRRDFSVNAMAISLHPNSRGLLLDPTNGAADIERRELRALHSRSFFDDPSRVYRLLRLGIRLDFKPDERTARWLETALENKVWETMREEQQARELRAVLEEDLCGRVIKAMRDRDLLAGLDRKLAPARIDLDKFERVHSALGTAGGDNALTLNLLALTSKLGEADRARLAKKVLGDAKAVKFALGLDREAARLAKLLQGAKAARPSYVYQVLNPVPRAVGAYLLVHYPQAAVQTRVKSFFTKVPAIRAGLPRTELESLGVPAGPKFDQVLERVFLDELDGKIKTPQQMTKVLCEYAGVKPPAPPPPPPKIPIAKPAPSGAKPGPPAAKPGGAALPHRAPSEAAKPAKVEKAAPKAVQAAAPGAVKAAAAPAKGRTAKSMAPGARGAHGAAKSAKAAKAAPARPKAARAAAKPAVSSSAKKPAAKPPKPRKGGKRAKGR